MVKTLTQLRYRIDEISFYLETMVQTSHLNIEKIIDLRNVDGSSTLVENMDTFDMNNIFPIKNNEELVSFETSINKLIIKI